MEKKSWQTLDDTLALLCTIEKAQNTQGHTEYVIRVDRTLDSSWHVIRRYKDFVVLHTALHASCVDLPLPPKKVFGNMEREFVAERQLGLQNYLNVILSHPILASSLVVKKFLDPHNYSQNYVESALQCVSMLIRSEAAWEVVEPMPAIGWRIRKEYFLVRNVNDGKKKYLLSWTQLGPDYHLDDKDVQGIFKALAVLKHPNIFAPTFASASDSGGFIIQPLIPIGSLRDQIYKTQFQQSFLRKYANPKDIFPVPLNQIRLYGRQILNALKFLHDKGLAHGHLHAGNIFVEDGVCRISDLHNHVLGVRSYYRHFLVQLRKISTLEAIDAYSFGHVIYEMAFGLQLQSPTCTNYPPEGSSVIITFLETILAPEACKGTLPTISELLLHPLFRDQTVDMSERPWLKLSAQLKDALRKCKEQTEDTLRQQQKTLRQMKRLSKAQAILTAEDDRKKKSKTTKKETNRVSKPNISNGNKEDSRPTTPQISAPSAPSPSVTAVVPSSPILSDPPPAPPPPPSLSTFASSTSPSMEGISPTSSSSSRPAFLGSIEAFNKNALRKAQTNDRSTPTVF